MRAKVFVVAAADCWNSPILQSSPNWRHLDYLLTFTAIKRLEKQFLHGTHWKSNIEIDWHAAMPRQNKKKKYKRDFKKY